MTKNTNIYRAFILRRFSRFQEKRKNANRVHLLIKDMVWSSSELIWKGIERRTEEDQKKLLQWQLQAREPIRRFSDIRAGDHLVRKESFMKGLISYEHHFLCVGFDDKKNPKIMHYYNTSWNASLQLIPTSLGSGAKFEQLGKVQEMTLPHKDFIKSEEDLQAKGNEVERVVWPEELRRYSVAEVTKRAEDRKGEKWYNIVRNNCETFVMYCLCGLQISPQVTSAVEKMSEVGGVFVKSARHAAHQFGKAVLDMTDDVLFAARGAARNVLPRAAGLGIGAAVTVIIESYLAYRDICEAKKKWDAGIIIKTRREFIKEVISVVVMTTSRTVGSVVGMIAGEFLIPVPVVGAIIGAVVGLNLNLRQSIGLLDVLTISLRKNMTRNKASYHRLTRTAFRKSGIT